MKLRVVLAATLSVMMTSVVASAQQPWIKDRRYGEGAGVRAGNLELHPGIAGEFGYDSNFFLRSDSEGTIPVYRLRLTPHLTLSTLGPQRRGADGEMEVPTVNFQAGVYGALNQIIKADSKDDLGDYSTTQLAGGANFMLDVLPQRPLGFDLYGDWLRSVDPSNQPEDSVAFNRNSFRAGTGVNWRPGGGLFTWRLGYEINYHLFEKSVFDNLNNARHYVKTRTSWRFLPRTAFITDADYGLIRYSEARSSQNDGETLQGRIGLNGLVTNHFMILAMGGWGASFFDRTASGIPARNYDGPVAQGELRWFISPAPTLEATSAPIGLSSVAVGGTRTFQTSYLGSFYVRNRGYLNFSYFLGGSFLVSVEGGYSVIEYPQTFYVEPAVAAGFAERAPSFTEKRIDAQLFAEYRLTDGFGVNTTIRYDQNMTDTKMPLGNPAGPKDDLEFQRVQAYLGLRLFL